MQGRISLNSTDLLDSLRQLWRKWLLEPFVCWDETTLHTACVCKNKIMFLVNHISEKIVACCGATTRSVQRVVEAKNSVVPRGVRVCRGLRGISRTGTHTHHTDTHFYYPPSNVLVKPHSCVHSRHPGILQAYQHTHRHTKIKDSPWVLPLKISGILGHRIFITGQIPIYWTFDKLLHSGSQVHSDALHSDTFCRPALVLSIGVQSILSTDICLLSTFVVVSRLLILFHHRFPLLALWWASTCQLFTLWLLYGVE